MGQPGGSARETERQAGAGQVALHALTSLLAAVASKKSNPLPTHREAVLAVVDCSRGSRAGSGKMRPGNPQPHQWGGHGSRPPRLVGATRVEPPAAHHPAGGPGASRRTPRLCCCLGGPGLAGGWPFVPTSRGGGVALRRQRRPMPLGPASGPAPSCSSWAPPHDQRVSKGPDDRARRPWVGTRPLLPCARVCNRMQVRAGAA